MQLEDMRGWFCYLATPYSRYKMGIDAAAYDAAEIAAKLMKRGIFVFSPIAHSHAIAKVGRLDPLDAEFWEWADRPFVKRTDACIVATMDGWEESAGVAHEIASFLERKLPVVYIDPQEI